MKCVDQASRVESWPARGDEGAFCLWEGKDGKYIKKKKHDAVSDDVFYCLKTSLTLCVVVRI